MDQHEPLYYATYLGDQSVWYAGHGLARRGYTLGSKTQIGAADLAEIQALPNHEDFLIEPVPAAIIGTAEETQPFDHVQAIARNAMLAELDRAEG